MSYTTSLDEGILKCELCPHECHIADGGHGICNVRLNDSGQLSLPYYGRLSALASDPIEKKPLYHYYPGSTILSAGFYGCNFRCPFCQNYTISQSTGSGTYVSPEDLVSKAESTSSIGIAYTYSEPLVHFEYIVDSAKRAKDRGLANVIVSNGYLNDPPAKELLNLIDAANIDLKAFGEQFYRREIKGDIKHVKRFIELAAEMIHLEVTTLVIPTKNDTDDEISNIAQFLASIDRSIPLHLSCYYPTYKYVLDATPPETVIRLTHIAGEYLDYVYPGNVGLKETVTECPSCGKTLIKRTGYRTKVEGISDGTCISCGRKTDLIGV